MAIPQKSINDLLLLEPFRPFRILTATGKEYPVENPHLIVVMPSEIFYAYPNQDRWTLIPLSHITSVDVGQAA